MRVTLRRFGRNIRALSKASLVVGLIQNDQRTAVSHERKTAKLARPQQPYNWAFLASTNAQCCRRLSEKCTGQCQLPTGKRTLTHPGEVAVSSLARHVEEEEVSFVVKFAIALSGRVSIRATGIGPACFPHCAPK